MFNPEDSIAAIATGAGGAIGLIRVSGSGSVAICDGIFQSVSGKKLSIAEGYSVHFGKIIETVPATSQNSETGRDYYTRQPVGNSAGTRQLCEDRPDTVFHSHIIDEVLLTVFRTPHSYTGQDMVEISCHGSSYILRSIMELLLRHGARQASPGEFTVRAFMNGKMDLSQAEAVAELISSSDAATHSVAMSQLRGGYSRLLSELREKLLTLASFLELELDFGEEEVEFADRSHLEELVTRLEDTICGLIESFRTGNAVKEGVSVAIVGNPNVGKSTLLNTLLQEEKAIVSEIPGTTRDIIEDTVLIGGIKFRFADTAGIRETLDSIENIGIDRARENARKASIVLYLAEAPEKNTCVSSLIVSELGKLDLQPEQKVIVLFTKADRLYHDPSEHNIPENDSPEGNRPESGSGTEENKAYSRSTGCAINKDGIVDNLTEDKCHLIDKFFENDGNALYKSADDEIHTINKSYDNENPSLCNPEDNKNASIGKLPDNQIRGLLNSHITENSEDIEFLYISSRTGYNIDVLRNRLCSIVNLDEVSADTSVVTNLRHLEAFENTLEALGQAKQSLRENLPSDMLAHHIREALYYLGTITGEITNDQILGNIFSKFCIGK